MKQFIYLDTDIVNSIIAQNEKGLILKYKYEDEELISKKNSKKTSGEAQAGGFLNAISLLKAELKLKGSVDFIEDKNNQSISTQIVTKSLHDAAFDIAYNIIKEEDKLVDKESELGDFIELKKIYQFIDFDYFEGLFEKNGLVDFVKDSEKNKVEEAKNGKTNRKQKRDNNFNKILKERKEEIDKNYDDLKIMINLVKKLIPYKRMLVSLPGGFIIPLDDKYFRDNPETIGFKHGAEMTCFGYITNVIGKDTKPLDNKNIFENIEYSVNEVLRLLLPVKDDNLFIVHPIAIYYGG